MAMAVITVKIMPESPDVDLSKVEAVAGEKIDAFTQMSGEKRFVVEPIAFGLNALNITFVMDEKVGSTEPLEASLGEIEGVQSVETTDVRRAIG